MRAIAIFAPSAFVGTGKQWPGWYRTGGYQELVIRLPRSLSAFTVISLAWVTIAARTFFGCIPAIHSNPFEFLQLFLLLFMDFFTDNNLNYAEISRVRMLCGEIISQKTHHKRNSKFCSFNGLILLDKWEGKGGWVKSKPSAAAVILDEAVIYDRQAGNLLLSD